MEMNMFDNMPPDRREPVCVLVVDDHPHTAATLARAISRLWPEVDVIAAEDGLQALDLVNTRTVDVLITDMVMPGVTGLDLIEILQTRPNGRHAYTVLMTAYDVPSLIETARYMKVNKIVGKPIQPEHICQIIAKAYTDVGLTPPATDLQRPPADWVDGQDQGTVSP